MNKYSDGSWIQIGVHRIVCSAFHGPAPYGFHAAHINGVPSDNRPDNLRWSSAKENERDKVRHGTNLIGSRNPASKLGESQVLDIRDRISKGSSGVELSREYGVTEACISYIKTQKGWRHI